MKILYYSPHPHLNMSSPSGYGTHIREIIEAFGALGHQVLPVIMGGTELSIGGKKQRASLLKESLKKIIPAYLWESIKDYWLLKLDERAKKNLLEKIKTFQPDLIYERGSYLQLSGATAAKQAGIRHILEVNAPYVEERKMLQGDSVFISKAEKIEKKQLELAGKIVVVSSVLKEYFVKKHSLPPQKVILTPNAVNPEKIKPDTQKSSLLKQQLGLENKTVIGFVGSIFPWHGVDLMLRACAVIAKEHHEIKLLIVGGGETLEELKKLSAQLNLNEKTIFTGNVPHKEVYNYIALMDITVMPQSNRYGSPVKIFEYGAMKKAVIAPDVQPVRDVMENGKDGLLIQPNPQSLVAALTLLIENMDMREKIAEHFHLKIISSHTWKKNAEKILA